MAHDTDPRPNLIIPADTATTLLTAIRAYLAGNSENDADWDAMMDNLEVIKETLAEILVVADS